MPDLFRSNLVTDANVEVFTSYPDVVPRTGEPITRWELKPAFWGGGDVAKFRWLEKGPFDAVVGYRAVGVGGGDGAVMSDHLLKVPVRFFSRFHRWGDVARLRRQMRDLLGERREGWSLQRDQSMYGDYFPGAVALGSGGAAAAMVKRHFMETFWRREDRVALGITDVQGNVLTPMSRPTNWWDENAPAPRPKAVGNMARMVELLQRGPYAAVNGRRSWRVFRTVATRPGSTKEQIARLNNLEVHEIGPLLKAMENEEVILLWRDGYYLNVGGRRLYADAERVTAARVLKQQGEYARPDGRYRRTQRRHNMGTTETALALHLQGFPVFSALGMNIDYYLNRRRFRVSPDTFVLLPPGILVAVEFERSAKTLKAIQKKVWPYQRLAAIGRPVPVLFVTETEEAARIFAELRLPHMLVTTLERLKQGPQGRAVIDDNGDIGGEPGCWTYWYSNHDSPVHDAPINLWTELKQDEYRPWWVGDSQLYSASSLAEMLADNQLDDSRIQDKTGAAELFLHFF